MTAVLGFADRAEWLAARRQGIGASEAATILGLNPYQSPTELYLRKLGEMPEQDESWPMKLGTHMEGLLAKEYERRFRTRLETQVFQKHVEHPWLFATLDGLTPDGVVVEFKTASWRSSGDWGEPDTDAIPTPYLVQAQHQLEVSGLDACHVFASIDRAEPTRYIVHRQAGLGQTIVEACRRFWQCVCDRTPPVALLRPDDHRLMHLIYPEEEGSIGLGREVADLVDHRDEIARKRRELDEASGQVRTAILAAMGPFSSARLPDGRTLTRKIVAVEAQTTERKAYTFTDLRVRKAKS